MRLWRIALSMLLLALAAAGPAAAAQSFVEGLPDVPLMDGLTALPDSGVIFDKPDGRIVEAYAAGEVAAAKVLSFYGATLPSLGWRQRSPRVWAREGERLELELLGPAQGLLTLRFVLSPDR